jgi:hypothetical protein
MLCSFKLKLGLNKFFWCRETQHRDIRQSGNQQLICDSLTLSITALCIRGPLC